MGVKNLDELYKVAYEKNNKRLIHIIMKAKYGNDEERIINAGKILNLLKQKNIEYDKEFVKDLIKHIAGDEL